jgi:hypothetical protein
VGHFCIDAGNGVSKRLLHAWLLASATAAVLAYSGVPSIPRSLTLVGIAAAVIMAMRIAVLAGGPHELAIGSLARAPTMTAK